MNTPAHAVLNLLVVGRGGQPWKPILLGAVLPDLPMLAMYLVERVVLGTPELVIWQDRYYDPAWQFFIDVFNSMPMIAMALVIAYARRWSFLQVMLWSMALHVGIDFLTHVDDAHRHFLPFSDWRFESAVSYWDPDHHGRVFATLEFLFVVAGSGWLSSRGRGVAVQRLGVGILVATALLIAFALIVWAPLGTD